MAWVDQGFELRLGLAADNSALSAVGPFASAHACLLKYIALDILFGPVSIFKVDTILWRHDDDIVSRIDRIVAHISLHLGDEGVEIGGRDEDGEEVEASLTFDHEVVGVIYSSDRLASSDQSVGTTMTHAGQEFNRDRGLDSSGDLILLSEDRRTINLKLRGDGERVDQVRVLVALN